MWNSGADWWALTRILLNSLVVKYDAQTGIRSHL